MYPEWIMRSTKVLAVFCCLTLVFISTLHAGIVREAHVEAQLVPEVQSVEPGKSFWIGLNMKIDEEWHIYWRNPGDSGLATKVEWDLPVGFEASPIHWPYPKRIPFGPLVSYGYEGEVLLLTKIRVPESVLAPSSQPIKAEVDWLACKTICIPGSAKLEFQVSIEHRMGLPTENWITKFSETRAQLPLTSSDWVIQSEATDQIIWLRIFPPEEFDDELSAIHFFPYSSKIVDHARPQILKTVQGGYELLVPRSSLTKGPLERLEGVLVSEEGWRGKNSEKALELVVRPRFVGFLTGLGYGVGVRNLGFALLFAFFGGLILNLMPCVLPVLSIKILHFTEYASRGRSKLRTEGLSFAAGVVSSFLVLGALLAGFREAGAQIGWGFQLQSPIFVAALVVLFFILGLNLWGVFEIGLSLTRIGGFLTDESRWSGSFLSGVLVTIVATPCTAPFMGSAIGFGLTQSPQVSLAIFACLGFGMAVPFLLLSFFPDLFRFVPKPGRWMLILKRILAIPLFATVLWLVWILTFQIRREAFVGIFFGLCLVAASLWIVGKHVIFESHAIGRRLWRVGSVSLIVVGIAVILMTVRLGSTEVRMKPKTEASAQGIMWEPFSMERLHALRDEGKPVFINFTAAWCLTCKVNERIALRSSNVVRRFKELNIQAMKADWTTGNSEITQALGSYGRSSIPLYVLYDTDPKSTPKLLPEILTPSIVLGALEGIETPDR